ncbi:MAG: hypothetical protein NUV51_00160 [Sulfuricaulis sp.]|nr:hypothetical protein [Sulfuricaulis sp.]
MGAGSHKERGFPGSQHHRLPDEPCTAPAVQDGQRDSLFVINILNDKNTAISYFSLLEMWIDPATRETFAGEKNHLGLAETGRIRHFLARMEPALEFVPERIKEGLDIHHFHNITARHMPEKHGTSCTLPIPRVSGKLLLLAVINILSSRAISRILWIFMVLPFGNHGNTHETPARLQNNGVAGMTRH